MLKWNFIVVNVPIKKEERSQMNNLTFHLRKLEKEEQSNPKASRRKEIIKIGEEINVTENRKTTEKISKTKNQSF